MHDRSRLLAGKILGRLALPQLRANLIPIITTEIDRAFFYFHHHHTIQSAYPQYDLHVLKDALLTGYHSVIDFIIELLGVAGEIERFRTAFTLDAQQQSQSAQPSDRDP